MKQSLSIIPLLTLSLSLVTSVAQSQESKHTVAIEVGAAGGEFKGSSKDGDGFGLSYLYYNYQAFENISFEAGYIGGSQFDDWDCVEDSHDTWTCSFDDDDKIFNLTADDFSLNGFVVAIKGDLPLSKRNSLYGKLGGQYYDYNFSFHNRTVEEDSGTGVFVEGGWQYRWDMGIGMKVGLRYQDLGDLTLKSSNVGISYTF